MAFCIMVIGYFCIGSENKKYPKFAMWNEYGDDKQIPAWYYPHQEFVVAWRNCISNRNIPITQYCGI